MQRQRIKTIVLAIMMIVMALLLSSCIGDFISDMELRAEIIQLNDEALALIDEGEYEEAIDLLNQALSIATENERLIKMTDTIYNNLGYAYVELGEYERSLEYIDKALEILPNDEYEYTNKANALQSLGRLEEAQEFYELALKENKHNANAHYGLGMIHYEAGRYDQAIEAFDTYLTYYPMDIDAMYYKVDSYLMSGNERTARQYAEAIIQDSDLSYDGYEMMEMVLDWAGDYEELKQLYEDMALQFPDRIEALMKLGELDYNYGKYRQSLAHFIDLLDAYPDHSELYSWIIYNYSALNQLESALTYYEEALAKGIESAELHVAIGDLYYFQTYYMEAIPYYDLAIMAAPYDEGAYLDKLLALHNGKRFSKCTAFGDEIEDLFPYSSMIPWRVAECYYELQQYKKAIAWYERALENDPDNDRILSDIGYSYLSLGDVKQALLFSERSLAAFDGNNDALHIQKVIEEEKEPIGKRIRDFIVDNYLYYNAASSDVITSAFSKDHMTNDEIDAAVEIMRAAHDDLFTFVIYGPDYDEYVASIDWDVHYEAFGDVHYIQINSFSTNTDTKVIDILDGISNSEQQILVLDLRGNMGGLTHTANNILDVLLGDVVTSSLITRDGYHYPYYSDASQIKFKRIVIFIDEETASAAELLTLGLKTYLNHTVIIGRPSFGKGVGQTVFEDKTREIAVMVTNHYWNVRQHNIMGSHIMPDIYVEGHDLQRYMDAIPLP